MVGRIMESTEVEIAAVIDWVLRRVRAGAWHLFGVFY